MEALSVARRCPESRRRSRSELLAALQHLKDEAHLSSRKCIAPVADTFGILEIKNLLTFCPIPWSLAFFCSSFW